jgi:UDP:flavonoid glycosyltransferase YjiC (YdhE family)
LAIGFKEAGHTIRLCTHGIFSDLVCGRSIEFVPFGEPNPQASQKADYQNRPKTKVGVLWRILRRQTRPDWNELQRLEDLVASSDLVICNHLADRTYHVAEKAGIPCAFAYLHPTHPTRSFMSTVSPQGLRLGRAFNLATHLAVRHLYWLKNRKWINEWRTQKLGLGPLSWLGPFQEQYNKRLPYIFGFNHALVPSIDDWPEWYLITGYWFHPQPSTDKVSPELKRFVQSGEKPVVVAFGSVASPEMPHVLEETVSAIKQLGGRVVVVTGWGEHSLDSTENVFVTPSVPYGWLFPRASVVIHAGGSGTVAEVAKAGIPSIPVPFAAEQKFWSHRLWKLGVATKPIRHSYVSKQTIMAALEEIKTRDEMRIHAAELARKIELERGTEAAVEFLSNRISRAQRNEQ